MDEEGVREEMKEEKKAWEGSLENEFRFKHGLFGISFLYQVGYKK